MNNITPMQWLLIAAPSAILGAFIFILLFESAEGEQKVKRQEILVEKMEFNRDFASAWNGAEMVAPENDIEEEKKKLAQIRAMVEEEERKRSDKLKALSEKLNNELERESVPLEQVLSAIDEASNVPG